MKLKLFFIFFIFYMQSAFGIEKTIDPNTIHKNLRCLVCQGQSISDSNSDFAQTIKLSKFFTLDFALYSLVFWGFFNFQTRKKKTIKRFSKLYILNI